MEAIRVTDKEWEIAGVHYVRTEAMCNGFGVSLEMEFGEDKAGDEYILVLDGIHPVSTCRLHQLDENTGKIERVATLKEYRGQHYGAAAITAAEDWFAERGGKKIFINLCGRSKADYRNRSIPVYHDGKTAVTGRGQKNRDEKQRNE